MAITDKLSAIADAIRAKTGESGTMKLEQMPGKIAGISTGITPSGNINITDTQQTDVTNYATAQVVDANLTAENIADGVTVLGIVGTHQGGGGGGEQPQLYAPTISLDVYQLEITNSIKNGSFSPTSYSVYIDGVWRGDIDYTGSPMLFDTSIYASVAPNVCTLTVKAKHPKFADSEISNSITWHKYFTVIFYDGDTILKTAFVQYGSTIADCEPDAEKSGYELDTWCIDSTLETAAPITTQIVSDASFYAKWREISDIKFDLLVDTKSSKSGKVNVIFGLNGSADINWGDGTAITTISGTDLDTPNKNASHQYAVVDKIYTIKITITGQAKLLGGVGSSDDRFPWIVAINENPKDYSTRYANRTAAGKIKSFAFSEKVLVSSYCFSGFGVTDMVIPAHITSVPSYLIDVYHMKTLTFMGDITDVGNRGLWGEKLTTVDLIHCTAVPTAATTDITYPSNSAQIRVPASLYTDWISAPNWSNISSKITAVS